MRIRDKATGKEYNIVSMVYEQVGGGSLFTTGTPDEYECVPCKEIYESNPVTRAEFDALVELVKSNSEHARITGIRLAKLEAK